MLIIEEKKGISSENVCRMNSVILSAGRKHRAIL